MSAALPLVVEVTREFLRRHAPFDRMSDAALEFAIPRLSLAYFPKDAVVLAPEAGPVTHLHVVQRGLVASHSLDPRNDLDPTVGPGECFPVGALSAGGAATKRYVAVQDAFCYCLARDDFLALRQQSPEFERFCTQAVTETLKQSMLQMQGEYSQRAALQQTLTQPLANLLRRPLVTCETTATVATALAAMREARVRTIVVINAEGAPAGIFTLIDLLERVVLPERPLSTAMAKVMSTPLATLPASATAAEAMQLLAERGIRQVTVVDGGKAVGMVSERDLFALQRVSMRQVGESVRNATDRASLQRAAADIRALTQNLLAQGATAEPLTRTVAALNDALSRQVIELALARHDLADTDWCWLALGSEGRGEQTFATDQDNALIFVTADPARIDVRREQLLAFARDVNAELDAIGFPLCTGKVMAGNPEMCLTVDEWRSRFLQWLREPTPQALLGANIVFDFRPLYGDTTLSDGLRTWLGRLTSESSIFLRLMAQNALETDAPLGLVRAFATDDNAAHRGTVDLKSRGTRLFVDVARVFALALALPHTGTAARLRAAGAALNVEPRYVAATIDAFHFLQLLRLRNQYVPDVADGANRIDPYALNEVDQRMLKEAFRQARKLQQRLKESYQL